MKDLLAIALGGILGAMARYGVYQLVNLFNVTGLPVATLLVNCIGSFGLAYFLQKTLHSWALASHWRLGVATGFFGAFTTFSTLMLENVNFIMAGNYLLVLIYLLLTALLAGLSGLAGWVLADRESGEPVYEEREQ